MLYYNGWKGSETITNVIAFTPYVCICWASINAPGSWHDSALSSDLYRRLDDPTITLPTYRVLADSAFNGQCSGIMKQQDADVIFHTLTHQQQYDMIATNNSIARTRVAAEWGMHTLQSVFRRLNTKLPFNVSADKKLIKLCLHLNNLRCRTIGYNQIRNTFMAGE